MRRTFTLLAAALVGALLVATPAHATPEPAPTADAAPTPTTTAGPCVLPTVTPTIIDEVPQPEGPSVLDSRRLPRLPLPVHCFVTFEVVCAGTLVTLRNPVPVAIKYRVGDEDGTHTVGPGETEQVVVPKEDSPFGVFIVISDDPDGPRFPVTRHRWKDPGDCTTPTPGVTPTPTPAPTSQGPQLPVTGQAYAGLMTVGFVAGGVFVTALACWLLWWAMSLVRRRRGAA